MSQPTAKFDVARRGTYGKAAGPIGDQKRLVAIFGTPSHAFPDCASHAPLSYSRSQLLMLDKSVFS